MPTIYTKNTNNEMTFLKGHVSAIEDCPMTTGPHTQTYYPRKFLYLTNEALTESSKLQ